MSIFLPEEIAERMREFGRRNILFKALLREVVKCSDTDHTKKLRKEFSKFALDEADGVPIELVKMDLLRRYKLTDKEISRIFSGTITRDGKIPLVEFVTMTIDDVLIPEVSIKQAFDNLSNHREYILAASLKNLFGNGISVEDVFHMLPQSCLPSGAVNYAKVRNYLRIHNLSRY